MCRAYFGPLAGRIELADGAGAKSSHGLARVHFETAILLAGVNFRCCFSLRRAFFDFLSGLPHRTLLLGLTRSGGRLQPTSSKIESLPCGGVGIKRAFHDLAELDRRLQVELADARRHFLGGHRGLSPRQTEWLRPRAEPRETAADSRCHSPYRTANPLVLQHAVCSWGLDTCSPSAPPVQWSNGSGSKRTGNGDQALRAGIPLYCDTLRQYSRQTDHFKWMRSI